MRMSLLGEARRLCQRIGRPSTVDFFCRPLDPELRTRTSNDPNPEVAAGSSSASLLNPQLGTSAIAVPWTLKRVRGLHEKN
jgi:hypothetical protein